MKRPSAPSSRGRKLEVTSPGPGPGAGLDRNPERTATILARSVVVATIVIGQLWGLTVALDAYFDERMARVFWVLGFEALSFLLALAVWMLAPGDR